MACTFTCPDCGAEHPCGSEERIEDQPDVTVARRQTGFSGGITSLNELGNFGFMVELPCGCRIYTVN